MGHIRWVGVALAATAFVVYAQSTKPVTSPSTVRLPPASVIPGAAVEGADLTAYGFRATKEIRYDESMAKQPTPHIPKGWRLVSVANGSTVNASNLWFTDAAGNIYLLQGFTARDGDFILKPEVQTLRPE